MGQRPDDLPEIEVLDEGDHQVDLARVTIGTQRRRRDLAVAVVVVAVVAGVIASTTGGDGAPEVPAADAAADSAAPSPDRTTTTVRRTTTTSEPRTSTTLPEAYPLSLPGLEGARIVAQGEDGRPVVVDLATGAVVARLAAADVTVKVGVPGGVVALSHADGRVVYLPLDGGEPVSLGLGWDAHAASADAVWVTRHGPDDGLQTALVGIDGTERGVSLDVPWSMWTAVPSREGVYFTTVGGPYRLGVDGSIRRIDGLATAEAATPDHVVGLTCDEEARCGYSAVHLPTGAIIDLGVPQLTFEEGLVVGSSAGPRVAIGGWSPAPSFTLHDLETAQAWEDPVPGPVETAAWLPDGRVLAVDRGSLHVIDLDRRTVDSAPRPFGLEHPVVLLP